MRLPFVIFAMLVCCVAVGAQPVRVLTFNIHHAEGDDARVDLDRIARVVLSVTPDVVCLQEVDRGLPRTQKLDFPALLSEKLKMRSVFEPNYLFDGGEYGNAVFTNLPIKASRNHKLPGPPGIEPRGCLEVTLDVAGKPLTILNTHLGLKPEERAEQVTVILAFLPMGNVLLAGDLNEIPTGKPIAPLLARLSDTFAVAAATGPANTYSTTVLNRRIDYCLVTAGIRVVESRILNDIEAAAASDHLPYLTVIELP